MDFQPAHAQTLPQFGGRAGPMDLAEMHQGDFVAAFGFIQIGCGDDDGETVCGQVRQHVPKFPP